MRWGLRIVGVLMVLLGGVWIGQGLNLIPGSFMTGQAFWAWAGAGTFVVGAGLLVVGLRRRAE